MPPRPFRTLVSSALTAAFLNLAASVLDHPRALASFPALGLPLSAGFVLLVIGGGSALIPLEALGARLGFERGALGAGLRLAFVLAAALAPLVEVGLREASPERASVVLACAAGFVACAAVAAGLVRARSRMGERGAAVAVAAPLAALAVLVTLWGVEYHAGSRSLEGALILAGAVAIAGSVRASRSLPPAPLLAALSAAVLTLGAFDAFPGRGSEPSSSSADGSKPPVVLITVDTLRADRVLGGERTRVPTPSIDALAADSVVFRLARSAAPWTKPSLATLLTGLSPLVHGMSTRRARLSEGIQTMAERLRAAGYHTGGLGLNAHLERAFRFDQGFDDYAFPARPDYGIALGARLLERWAPARFPALYPSTTAIADAAVEWLGAHAHEPFFLWLHVLDPHWPYEPPAEWLAHPALEPRRWGEPTMVTNVQAGNTKPGAAERERVAELYAGEIRYVDAELTRVLAALHDLDLYERALIVFASDHGEEFWEHGRYEHGHTLYDEVLRVPLFFKLPGAGPRARIDAPVSTEALLPTMLDVLGIPFDPEELCSRSLRSYWLDPSSVEDAPLFATGTYYFGEKRGVVFGGQKLVVELDTGRSELFDLAADPQELHSLTAARPGAREQGLRLIDEWETRCARIRARLGLPSGETAETDGETQRMLRGLGYIGAD